MQTGRTRNAPKDFLCLSPKKILGCICIYNPTGGSTYTEKTFFIHLWQGHADIQYATSKNHRLRRTDECGWLSKMDIGSKTWPWYVAPPLSLVHPCELHCRPATEYFSEKLLDTVTDGTPCFMHNNSRSICVNGVCKVVWLGKRLIKTGGVGWGWGLLLSRIPRFPVYLSSLLISQSWRTESTHSDRLMSCNLLFPKCRLCGKKGLLAFLHLLLGTI